MCGLNIADAADRDIAGAGIDAPITGIHVKRALAGDGHIAKFGIDTVAIHRLSVGICFTAADGQSVFARKDDLEVIRKIDSGDVFRAFMVIKGIAVAVVGVAVEGEHAVFIVCVAALAGRFGADNAAIAQVFAIAQAFAAYVDEIHTVGQELGIPVCRIVGLSGRQHIYRQHSHHHHDGEKHT